jgi:hypothetical protein
MFQGETSANFNIITCHYIPEDSKLQSRHRENLKSHKTQTFYCWKWRVVHNNFFITKLARIEYETCDIEEHRCDLPSPASNCHEPWLITKH